MIGAAAWPKVDLPAGLIRARSQLRAPRIGVSDFAQTRVPAGRHSFELDVSLEPRAIQADRFGGAAPLDPRGGLVQKISFREQFTNAEDACALAQSIVDTVRGPIIVLDKELRVIAIPVHG